MFFFQSSVLKQTEPLRRAPVRQVKVELTAEEKKSGRPSAESAKVNCFGMIPVVV